MQPTTVSIRQIVHESQGILNTTFALVHIAYKILRSFGEIVDVKIIFHLSPMC